MSKSKLKKELAVMTQEQVADLMVQVYEASKEAKAWLDFYLNPDIEALSEKYRKQIHMKCYGRNGKARRPKMRDCNQLIKTFSTIVQDTTPICDLMLYFTEEITKVATLKGRYSESYIRTLTGQFRKTLEYLKSTGLLEYSLPRIRKTIVLAESVSRYLAREYEEVLTDIQE
ncbi:MAG: hypothetical protein K2H22_04845 [Muribaculaceae bacterium]|nr:hypothetical protein [Muribaculaceae bacterium]